MKVDYKQLTYGIILGILSLVIAYLPILLGTPEKSTFNWMASQLAMIFSLFTIVLTFKSFDYNAEKDQAHAETKTEG